MVIVLLLAVRSRFNLPIRSYRTDLLLVALGFLEGCAADPAYLLNQEQAELAKTKVTAYNKPYKINGINYSPLRTAAGYRAQSASWYGSESVRRTASGVAQVEIEYLGG